MYMYIYMYIYIHIYIYIYIYVYFLTEKGDKAAAWSIRGQIFWLQIKITIP